MFKINSVFESVLVYVQSAIGRQKSEAVCSLTLANALSKPMDLNIAFYSPIISAHDM